jgi:alpha-N-arabinofuranosidase
VANLAQAVNVLQSVILTDGEKMILTPTYHVMEMYNVHQDALMLPVDVQVNDYTFGGQKLPAVSVSASRDKTGKVHISLVNIDPNQPQEVTINVRGMKGTGVSGRILTSAKVQDYNSFDKPDFIKPVAFKGATLTGDVLKVSLPAVSVVVLELAN